jgi:hypothetical protein
MGINSHDIAYHNFVIINVSPFLNNLLNRVEIKILHLSIVEIIIPWSFNEESGSLFQQ